MSRCWPVSWQRMLGSVLEVGVATRDIGASVAFYERLGFGNAVTGDLWTHHYGVMTCRGLCLGLHGLRRPSPWLAFAREDVAGLARDLDLAGLALVSARLGSEDFHELELRDPSGLVLRVQEARSFPPPRGVPPLTLLGRFETLSLPLADFDAGAAFWERLGAVVTRETLPFKRLRVELAGFALGFHRPTVHDEPMLLFEQPDLQTAAGILEDLGFGTAPGLGGYGTPEHRILASPEQVPLVLLA